MKKCILSLSILLTSFHFSQSNNDQPITFSQSDRDRLIRMEAILEQHDKRFEDINKRFEDINKRIDEIYTILWILSGVFTTITAATIGFAIWDRRTMIRPFETKVKDLDEKIEELKKEPLAKKLLDTLKEKAQTDKELEKILRTYHLL